MRKDIRIFALFLFMASTSSQGTFYLLFNNNCEGKSTLMLISDLVISLVISLLMAWLLQKAGARFYMKSSEKCDKNQ